jgi:hypothetical protein
VVRSRRLRRSSHGRDDCAFPMDWSGESDKLDAGVFVLDASTLLHLYRVEPAERASFLDRLHSVRDRLWVPHQAMHETRSRVHTVLSQRHRELSDRAQWTENELSEVHGVLSMDFRRWGIPPVERETQLRAIATVRDDLVRFIRRRRDQHDLHSIVDGHPDPLAEPIESLLEDRIGPEPTTKQLDTWRTDSDQRSRGRLPPSYADRRKSTEARHNDCVIWHQIVEFARSARRPIILVTRDLKEIGWVEHHDGVPTAHQVLVDEMYVEAGVPFLVISTPHLCEYVDRLSATDSPLRTGTWGDEATDTELRPLRSLLFDAG